MNKFLEAKSCPIKFVLAINDTMNVISGKWKLPIIGTLLFGKKRYMEMERSIPKITPRMLSKELKELEMNGIVRRTVHNTIPVTVEYELTDSGKTIGEVLDKMIEWGLQHRQATISD
jgi:DNA-binding HxlR family transcriptional regulator